MLTTCSAIKRLNEPFPTALCPVEHLMYRRDSIPSHWSNVSSGQYGIVQPAVLGEALCEQRFTRARGPVEEHIAEETLKIEVLSETLTNISVKRRR